MSPRCSPHDRGDRGAATVLVVALCGLLLLLGTALAVLGAAVVAHRRAQAAADLAALAGAQQLLVGADACAAATELAARHGARMVRCTVTGADVAVEVVVPGPRWHGLGADLGARARAGPVTGSAP
ncbi:Rv3654c family TadE-like protein [Nocardioides sp.]|uniref:Rv3654c family TadE-like protein n=1 Tax=Nocardioides sp. TaxID=35761 RepID=UPI0035186562